MRRYIVFLSPFLLALFFINTPTANATSCSGVLSTTGSFFQNYEQVHYGPTGFLILRFKINPAFANGRTIKTGWDTKNDECGQGSIFENPNFSIPLPKGITDFSIRFISPTHYDVWNDASSTPLLCPGFFPAQQGCSRDLPDFPDYYSFSWKALIDTGPVHTLKSSFHPIIQNPAPPPVLMETLPTPMGCTPYQFQDGNFFDNYERAEYTTPPDTSAGTKLLRLHYRFKSPANNGSAWKARMRTHTANCAPSINTFPSGNNASNTPYVRYWSIRFTTPTHWEMWNDEQERKEICTLCQGDVSSTTPFVSFMGANTPVTSFFRGTPFPIKEPKIGNSSVVFLPGVEASRLYTNGIFGERKLWEPLTRQDLRDLYLYENNKK